MRVILTGINPSMLVARARICQSVWSWLQASYDDHVGVFWGLPQEQISGRMLPLPHGVASAVNFGALCESAKPDVVISIGDDHEASHVAATLAVGMAEFKWVHILVDCERYTDKPYESILDADVVLAVGGCVADKAISSGCKNVVSATPTSPILQGFDGGESPNPQKYFLVLAKNFEASNLAYLQHEWISSGLASDGWELLLATNGGDIGDFNLSATKMPLGMRHLWSASSILYGVPDQEVVETLRGAWSVVDCGLSPASCLVAWEAAHFGVGVLAPSCEVYRRLGVGGSFHTTPFYSSSGCLNNVPHRGGLAGAMIRAASSRPVARLHSTENLLNHLSFYVEGRKERNFQVEVIRPS
jgi:hypothetical protein